MAGIWGNVDDDQPQGGLLAGLQRGFMNPMTLGGLGLLSGEGFGGAMRGMQVGAAFDDQRRQQEESARMKAAANQWYSNPENLKQLPPGMAPLVQAMGEKGVPFAAEVLAKNYQNPLETQYKQAQIDKLKREAANGGESPSNVREWEYFNKLAPEQKQQYLTMKRAEKYYDTGTQFVAPNPVNPGGDPRTITKNVAEKARLEKVGEAQGTAQAALPTIESNANRALDTIGKIRAHPGKQYGVGTAGVLPGIPGTQQKGFVTLVDQAKGQTFLEAFNSLRGGGAITESEGRKATEAFARLDRAQTQEDFDAGLADLEAVIKEGVRVARQKAGGDALSGRGGGQSFVPADDGWADAGGGVRIREKR